MVIGYYKVLCNMRYFFASKRNSFGVKWKLISGLPIEKWLHKSAFGF